jgi:hypothetical protein
MICDFCSAPNPCLSFDARTFIVEPFGTKDCAPRSEGAWAACAECGALVASHKWELLSVRAAIKFTEMYPEIPASVDELAEQFYGLYAGVLAGQLTGGISAQRGVAQA